MLTTCALVFSAGGAFGAYQAGVWQALEEIGFLPQIVAGASIGAVNAAAVARGATARRLQQWWRDPSSDIFRGNWSRTLRGRLEELLQEFPPASVRARLRVTATELPSTRIRVFQDEQVDASVLLAACAVPVFLAPVRVAGRRFVDGGLFCRLPAALTAEATDLVTVDLLAVPPSRLLRLSLNAAIVLRQVLLREPDFSAAPTGVPRRRIDPPQALGSPRDMLRWDPARIDRWIERGYRDAQRLRNSASPTQSAMPRAESAAPR